MFCGEPSVPDTVFSPEVEDFGEGLVNPSHECRRECGHGALHQTAIVDGAQLIDE